MPAGYQSGTTAPATCTVSNVFFDTDATAGSNWFGCTSANAWTVLGGGMGDPAANGIMVRTAANTSVARTATAGEGVTISNGTGVAGDPTFAADRAVVVFKGTGTADPSASCGDTGDPFQLLDFYLETDTSEIYQCVAIDTWVLSSQLGDDKVIVGSGASAPAVEAIPDCDDTGGNHLNYNTTGTLGSRFSCGTSGGAAAFDPSTTVDIMEEFIAGGSTDGIVGTHGWYPNPISTGSHQGQEGTLSHPGLRILSSHGTNDNSGVAYNLTNTEVVDVAGPYNAGSWSLDFLISPQSVTNVQFVVGLIDAYSRADRTNAGGGIWARFDTDASDATVIFQICNATGAAGCGAAGDDTNSKVVASTVAPSATGWYRIRISRDSATSTISMRVNDETAKTFCAAACDDTLGTIFTNTMSPVVHWLTRTTSGAQSMYLDYARFQVTGLTRY
jgi:hypothetical protein